MSGVLALGFAPLTAGFVAIPNIQAAGIDWAALGAWILPILRDLLTFLILGSMLIWWLPQPLERWTHMAKRAPLKSFGTGILMVCGGYLAALLGLLLILALAIFLYFIKFTDLGGIVLGIGLPALGIAFGVLNLVVAFISKLVVVFLLGKIIFERFYPKALRHNIWPLLLGLVIYLLVCAIPWFGWAVGVVVTLVGLGAIWLGWQKKPIEAGLTAEQPDLDPQAGD